MIVDGALIFLYAICRSYGINLPHIPVFCNKKVLFSRHVFADIFRH